ncbi:hypothetical protein J132_07691, partial [Termitomyces sp. J132]
IFSNASFDSFPEHKQWDYAIELIPDAEPSSCKVYLLVPYEQDELNMFLQENLSSGQIQPNDDTKLPAELRSAGWASNLLNPTHFIPTHTICLAQRVASLYLKNIWKLHGLSNGYVSDQNLSSCSQLQKTLSWLLPKGTTTNPAYDDKEYEVEEILNSRIFQGKLQFKVKWKRYGIKNISLEPQANICAPALVWNFYCKYSNAPKVIRGIYPISTAD